MNVECIYKSISQCVDAPYSIDKFNKYSSTGISNGQFIDLNSARNLLVLGFSIFFSLVHFTLD